VYWLDLFQLSGVLAKLILFVQCIGWIYSDLTSVLAGFILIVLCIGWIYFDLSGVLVGFILICPVYWLDFF